MSDDGPRITLSGHPKAAGSIRRAKGRGGIVGFLIGALGTWASGGELANVLMRGLETGIVGWLVCWFAAVTIWKHVVNAEVRSAIARRKAQMAANE